MLSTMENFRHSDRFHVRQSLLHANSFNFEHECIMHRSLHGMLKLSSNMYEFIYDSRTFMPIILLKYSKDSFSEKYTMHLKTTVNQFTLIMHTNYFVK